MLRNARLSTSGSGGAADDELRAAARARRTHSRARPPAPAARAKLINRCAGLVILSFLAVVLIYSIAPRDPPTQQAQPQTAKLKVYSNLKAHWGRAFPRIQNALQQHSPGWVQWVYQPEDADVRIVHVLGKAELPDCDHQNTVVIQHVTDCDLTQQEMMDLWSKALLVVSFHDLEQLVASVAPERQAEFRFHTMPWGAETGTFNPASLGPLAWLRKRLLLPYVMITGEEPKDESHEAVLWATARAGLRLVHTGNRDTLLDTCKANWQNPFLCSLYQHRPLLSNVEFASLLRYARYVPVLRRGEGFEMMGAEALLSGTRPLVFDNELVSQPYRWFKGHAVMVDEPRGKEDPLARGEDHPLFLPLFHLLLQPPPTISSHEHEQLLRKFSWEAVVPPLYDRIWHELRARRQGQDAPPQWPVEPSWWGEVHRGVSKVHAACMAGHGVPAAAAAAAHNGSSAGGGSAVGGAGGAAGAEGGCRKLTIVLDTDVRGSEACQTAAAYSYLLGAPILPPSALDPSTRTPGTPSCPPEALLLVLPHLYPDLLPLLLTKPRPVLVAINPTHLRRSTRPLLKLLHAAPHARLLCPSAAACQPLQRSLHGLKHIRWLVHNPTPSGLPPPPPPPRPSSPLPAPAHSTLRGSALRRLLQGSPAPVPAADGTTQEASTIAALIAAADAASSGKAGNPAALGGGGGAAKAVRGGKGRAQAVVEVVQTGMLSLDLGVTQERLQLLPDYTRFLLVVGSSPELQAARRVLRHWAAHPHYSQLHVVAPTPLLPALRAALAHRPLLPLPFNVTNVRFLPLPFPTTFQLPAFRLYGVHIRTAPLSPHLQNTVLANRAILVAAATPASLHLLPKALAALQCVDHPAPTGYGAPLSPKSLSADALHSATLYGRHQQQELQSKVACLTAVLDRVAAMPVSERLRLALAARRHFVEQSQQFVEAARALKAALGPPVGVAA